MVHKGRSNIVDEETHDEIAGILWEDDGRPLVRRRNTLASPERLTGFVKTVWVTLIVCLLLAMGHHYHHGRVYAGATTTAATTAAAASATGLQQQQQRGGTTSNGSGSGERGAVLVTGATGRLGALLYKELRGRGETVRAFVRDAGKARTVLGCSSCDESEGIFVGDVTFPGDLSRAMADGRVTTLAVAVGVGPGTTPEIQKAVEFDSVVSSVRALGMSASSENKPDLSVVFCSSMGTEMAPEPEWSGHILHWKLNAEAFLATSGIPVTIVKPCGLPPDMPGKNSTLMVGHHGNFPGQHGDHHTVSREDVAAVMAEAVGMARGCGFHRNNNLRFDLCSKPGPPTTDLKGLIESARWEWDQPGN